MKRGERRQHLTFSSIRWMQIANVVEQMHGAYAAYDLDKRVRQDGTSNADGTITLSCVPRVADNIKAAIALEEAEADEPAPPAGEEEAHDDHPRR